MTKLRTRMRCDVILAILLAEHRAPPRRGEGVQGAFPGASCVNIRARFSPLEQRWTKTACACDKHNGADAAANARPELAPCGKPLAIACGVVPDAFCGRPPEHLGPRVPQPGPEASRGREASGWPELLLLDDYAGADGGDAIRLLRVQLRRQGQRAAIPELLARRARRGHLRSIPEVALITGIGGARRTRARAVLRGVAVGHDRPADRGLGGEAVARTAGAGTGAVLRDVADARHRPAHGARGLEAVRWARRTRPRAVLCHVAYPRRRTTDRARRPEGICGTRRRRAGAVLRHVARVGRRAALDEGRL